MSGYDIEIKGLEEMRTRFAESPQIVGDILEAATKEAGTDIFRTAVTEAPHSTGNLQRSMHMEYKPIQVEVKPSAEYAKYVEFGTKPHYVNPSALESWAKKKGLNPFAVARSIRMKGTNANPFMERTKDKMEGGIQALFTRALEKITELLAK